MIKIYYFLVCSLIFVFGANAQENPFLFVKTSEDIGTRAITCMINDSYNQLWIGTYGGGLKKYNGITVETFKHDVNTASALSSSEIHDLYIDQKNTLWIATSNGLNLYNQKTATFSQFNPEGVKISVHSLAELDEIRIIVGTHEKGVYVFNTITKEFQKVILQDGIEENGLQVNDIAVDKLKRIWVGSSIGLMELDFIALKLKAVENRKLQNQDLLSSEIVSLETDTFGNLWAGTVQNGVLKIIPTTASNFVLEHYPITEKRIFSVKEYKDGLILCGSENDGLFVLSNDGQVLDQYLKEIGNDFSIQSNSVWSIHCDANDRIWMGYYDQGLNKYDPKHFKFSFLQNNNKNQVTPFPSSISAIAKDENERVWFSCIDKGVYVYEPAKNNYIHLNDPANNIAKSLNSMDIPSLFIDSKQNVWVASWYNGIYLLKKGSKRFINFSTNSHRNVLKSNRIVSFSEDSNGVIWIGTFSSGLVSYDQKTEKLRHHASEAFQKFELQNGNIRKVIVDKDDNVWMGTRKGIYRYNQKKDEVVSYNAKIRELTNGVVAGFIVFALYEDSKNNIWVGTDGYGLFSYSSVEDSFTWHGKDSEIRNMSINSITQTYDGFYWLGTDDGLIRYDQANENFRIFESEDGLLSKKINRSAFYTERNTLYLGTSEGINFFDFNNIPLNENLPKIIFQDLKIGNKRIAVSENGPLKKSIQYSDTILLSHDQSSFSIDFIGVNMTRGEKNNYAYMLEGLDRDWNYVDQLRTATFTNIKPGKYVFKLKAANNDGIWNDASKEVFIKVQPPYWATVGAKICYFVILCGLGFYIFRLIKLRVRERRKAEVERNQRKQTEELHAKKIQFFTNISHEFRTPLTLMLNPLESLLSAPDVSALPDDVRAKHRIIHRNTKRMKRLIDELMDFRKMQFGKIQLRVKETDLLAVVKNVTSYYEEEALYRNIHLNFAHEEIGQSRVWADTSMLEKIIFNLLSNAFKATKEGGAIDVVVRYHQGGVVFPRIDNMQPQDAFEVIIKDSGIGIKKENIRNIFERFYQDKDNNEQYYGGTGIGLEVVRKFVDYHKGKIEVESEEELGTSFKIFFAAGKTHFSENQFATYTTEQPQQNITQTRDENLGTTEPHTEKEHSLLIVEDNLELREYLKLELKGAYRVLEATNGKIGLEMAKQHKPDVIIADVMMPEMDGIEMCQVLKSNKSTSTIPVLMLTAKVAEKERIEGIDAGADVYLKKPFSVNLLKSHLRQLVKAKNTFYQTYFKSLELDVDNANYDKKILADVLNVIGNNLSKEDLCVQDIANELGLSRSKLYRKIKALTGNSANEIIRKTRLEKAKELLTKTDMTIGEICFKVGFASPSYFTKRFKEHTGVIPKEYRLNNKDQKEIATS